MSRSLRLSVQRWDVSLNYTFACSHKITQMLRLVDKHNEGARGYDREITDFVFVYDKKINPVIVRFSALWLLLAMSSILE